MGASPKFKPPFSRLQLALGSGSDNQLRIEPTEHCLIWEEAWEHLRPFSTSHHSYRLQHTWDPNFLADGRILLRDWVTGWVFLSVKTREPRMRKPIIEFGAAQQA
jgi:hypothetical protein